MSERNIHILLVEDEEAHVELIRRAFEIQEPMPRLTVAPRLDEAIQCVEEADPDIVFVDSTLPDGRGVDLIGQWATSHGATFPIVLMTSQDDSKLAEEATKAGAFRYMVKSPMSLLEIPDFVEHTLVEWTKRS